MTMRGLAVVTGLAFIAMGLAGCNGSAGSEVQTPVAAQAAQTAETPRPVETPPAPPAPPVAAPVPVEKLVLRIDCGASEPYMDKQGNRWAADQELADGVAWGADNGMTVDREGVGITGTEMPRIYETERYSMGSYKFTVPNGRYTVRLHFAETYEGIMGAGERVFSVSLQGQTVLKDIDPFKEVGALKPVVKEFKGISVENGQVVIGFTPNIENPQICGIEVMAE